MKNRRAPQTSTHRRACPGGRDVWEETPAPPGQRPHTRPLHNLAVALTAILLLTAPAPAPALALAQNRPQGNVIVECKPLSFQSRPGAPLVVDWALHWTGKGILQGDLEFAVYDDDGIRAILLGRFRLPDLVLSNVPLSTRMLLPPLDVRGTLAQATLRAQFVTKDFTFALPELVLFVPGPDKRSFTIAVPNGWGELGSPGVNAIVQHGLSFERFDPSPLEVQNRAVTVPTWIAPEDFPRDPLLLCTFDLIALVDEGLAELRQEHLDAALAWIDAGGGAFVRPGDLVEPRHVEFLNALARLEGNPAGFRLDAQRRLAWPDGWDPTAMQFLRKGLGRVVIAPRPAGEPVLVPRDTFDRPEWREVSWFLWRLRADLREGVVERGTWHRAARPMLLREKQLPVSPVTPADATDPAVIRPSTFGVEPLRSGDWLLDRLIPESVQLVPLWVVGCILALFVIVVGPVDYFVLGLFRLRRLTWVVFPIVALAFAWFTVWLSNRYMQTTEQSRALVILDVGDGGRIVRSNELKLYFANTSRANVIEAGRELLAPVDQRHLARAPRVENFAATRNQWRLYYDADSDLWYDPNAGWVDAEGNPAQFRRPGPGGEWDVQRRRLIEPPTYDGRPPSSYTLSEWLPQWTPHLHRRFRIRPPGEFVEFDWDALPGLASTANVRPAEVTEAAEPQDLVELFAEHFGSDVTVALLHRGQRQVLADGAGLFAESVRVQDDDHAASGEDFLFELCAPGATAGPSAQSYVTGPQGSLRPVPSGQTGGVFSLISQLAPTGGSNFEDLSLLDPSDDRQWLLLVAVRHENGWHLYRKLYVVE
ncbi:MAG TPA: hypothetical protein VML55_22505 [Planctomycetaceae bacterium]|nr:hypothetical protein [Planctomycetaceae bacterium]